MKIGIYLEGSPEMGGGFFQSIKSSLLLLDIKEHNQKSHGVCYLFCPSGVYYWFIYLASFIH